ncbi:16985_t:CDS:2 [Dentiscutata erythropus]|uniref:16985_t:CDS:1 n=1 Tax=Dentiscutata erythropus TaxID=1348616 RepID=A0A9N9PCM6_9GLOM|nr:16985_t:CDS:2 [Dentiscutata erythropus]
MSEQFENYNSGGQNEGSNSNSQNDGFRNQQENKYQEFSNAYVYKIMIKTANGTPNRAQVCREATQEWNKIKTKDAEKIDNMIKTYLSTPFNLYDIQTMKPNHFIPEESLAPFLPTIYSVEPIPEIPANAAAQKNAASEITIAKERLSELKQMYNITTDPQF